MDVYSMRNYADFWTGIVKQEWEALDDREVVAIRAYAKIATREATANLFKNCSKVVQVNKL